MSVEVKTGVGRQLEMYVAGSGIHGPRTRRIALRGDGAASCPSIERTMHASQFHTTGPSIGKHRARCRLLQGNVPTASTALESARDIRSSNRPAPRLRTHIPFDPIDLNLPRAGFSANRIANVGNFQTT